MLNCLIVVISFSFNLLITAAFQARMHRHFLCSFLKAHLYRVYLIPFPTLSQPARRLLCACFLWLVLRNRRHDMYENLLAKVISTARNSAFVSMSADRKATFQLSPSSLGIIQTAVCFSQHVKAFIRTARLLFRPDSTSINYSKIHKPRLSTKSSTILSCASNPRSLLPWCSVDT